MTTILGSRTRRRTAAQASSCYLHYNATTGLTLTGAPVDVTGVVGTFLRNSTSPSVDSGGNAYTAQVDQVAYALVDGTLVVLVRPTDGGRLVESIEFPLFAGVPSHTGYLRFSLASLTETRDILHWGDPAAATMTTLALQSAGDATNWYEVRWTVGSDGALTIGAAVDDGTESVGTTTAANSDVNDTPAAEVWFGGRGTLSVAGAGLSVAKIAPGSYTLAQMRSLN